VAGEIAWLGASPILKLIIATPKTVYTNCVSDAQLTSACAVVVPSASLQWQGKTAAIAQTSTVCYSVIVNILAADLNFKWPAMSTVRGYTHESVVFCSAVLPAAASW
jgi:hypothetical protein